MKRKHHNRHLDYSIRLGDPGRELSLNERVEHVDITALLEVSFEWIGVHFLARSFVHLRVDKDI
jgi:hypothetical protein